jgi:hypothetical protein
MQQREGGMGVEKGISTSNKEETHNITVYLKEAARLPLGMHAAVASGHVDGGLSGITQLLRDAR